MIRESSKTAGKPYATNLLNQIVLSDVEGMPLVVSEWDVCFPNSYAYEGLSMITAYAFLHDWDGMFLYSFSHSTNIYSAKDKSVDNWFDIKNNPIKLSQAPLCAIAFIREDVSKEVFV